VLHHFTQGPGFGLKARKLFAKPLAALTENFPTETLHSGFARTLCADVRKRQKTPGVR